MRVAILTDLPFWYFETNYLNELEKRMPSEGIATGVFVIHDSQIFGKLGNSVIMRTLNTFSLLKKLSSFDIIHVQFTFPLGFACTLLSSLQLLNKPIIIHTHGYDVFTVPSVNYGLRRGRIGKIFANYTWKRADRIITVCKKAKSEIEKSGIKEQKINVLYNAIDEKLFSKTKAEPSKELLTLRESGDLIFLSVASVVPVKNHVRLLKAFESIADKYSSKSKIKLALIGEHLPNSSIDVKSTNTIIYLGKKEHSQLKLFYSIADAFILPSLSEGHPLSLLEAMSCELPVIASNVGGIPETLNDKRFLVDPFDIDDISKKIELMIELNQKEREKIGTTNRQIVLDQFTIREHVSNLKRIYENVR